MDRERSFAGLVVDGQIDKVARGIERAVARSFEDDRARSSVILLNVAQPTQAEVKRRAEMCVRIFRELRGDLKWTVDRIVDELPGFLRKELDGISWEPEARRASWFAGT